LAPLLVFERFLFRKGDHVPPPTFGATVMTEVAFDCPLLFRTARVAIVCDRRHHDRRHARFDLNAGVVAAVLSPDLAVEPTESGDRS